MSRWLFVGEFAGFAGGIERYMHRAAAILRRNGHQVDLFCHSDSRSPEEFKSGFDRVWYWDDLDRLPDEYQLAVIHKVRTPELAGALRRRFPVAVVLHDHEFYCPRTSLYYPFTRRNCHRAYGRWFCGACAMLRRSPEGTGAALRRNFLTVPALWGELKNADAFVVLSQFMREQALRNGLASDRVHLVPPAIAVPPEVSHTGGTPPRLLVIGQWIRGKGIDQLLAAFPLIRHDCRIDLVGAGNDEAWLRQLAEPYGDKICFHGWTTRPEEFYRNATLAVLPWRWQEPFGLVGPEALAHEVPLVGFDVGGVREYLRDGETGLLVPEGDIAAFAAAVDRLLEQPELCRRFGVNGRRLVLEKFTETALLNGWEALEAASSAGRSRS